MSPARFASIEALEARTLLAASLPAGFAESVYARGFDTPTTMEFAPDGRLFVAEKSGAIKVVKNGQVQPTPFVRIAVDTYLERGVHGIAFDPQFSSNGHFYVYYTRKDNPGKNRLSRFTASGSNPDLAAAGSERILLDDVPSPTGFHNGGGMHFGPDGMLYLGIGDGGSRQVAAGQLDNLNGKVLRLNVSNPASLIPTDNPFYNTPGARKEIYALGFRNPFTSAIDPQTGRLFVNDVGSDKAEEVNDVRAGRNYGWPVAEGNSSDTRFTNPIITWPHVGGGSAAATGGVFYRATQFPAAYRNSYYYADYPNRWIKRMDLASGSVHNFATGAEQPIDLDVGPDGSLYYLSPFQAGGISGTNRPVMKISYGGAGVNRAPQAVASASRTSGGRPLKVDFTAAGSSDPDGDALTYRWNFGDGQSAKGRKVSHTFTADGQYDVRLTVSDGKGGQNTAAPIRVTVGNNAPQAAIELPRSHYRYRAGNRVRFEGSATDREDGKIPAGAFEWSVVFHHRDHTHPFIQSIADVKQGSFVLPRVGETDPIQFYRIHLTVTDSEGLSSTRTLDIRPRKSKVTLATNVPGLTLSLDGTPRATPFKFRGVEGQRRTLSAPLRQEVGGRVYRFVRWSDGGAAEHTIDTPVLDRRYTAEYREVRKRSARSAGRPVWGDEDDVA